MTFTRCAVAIAALAALSGCATYMDAKSNTAAGGQQSRDIAAAKTELSAAQAQNVRLSDEKVQRDREIKRNNDRIRAMETDLRKQDALLADALKAKQVSSSRHAELKREMDAIKAEMQSVDMQNRGDAFAASPDPKADAAKEARLRDLEKRKRELEGALAALTKR
jgi:hypothetical protein